MIPLLDLPDEILRLVVAALEHTEPGKKSKWKRPPLAPFLAQDQSSWPPLTNGEAQSKRKCRPTVIAAELNKLSGICRSLRFLLRMKLKFMYAKIGPKIDAGDIFHLPAADYKTRKNPELFVMLMLDNKLAQLYKIAGDIPASPSSPTTLRFGMSTSATPPRKIDGIGVLGSEDKSSGRGAHKLKIRDSSIIFKQVTFSGRMHDMREVPVFTLVRKSNVFYKSHAEDR